MKSKAIEKSMYCEIFLKRKYLIAKCFSNFGDTQQ